MPASFPDCMKYVNVSPSGSDGAGMVVSSRFSDRSGTFTLSLSKGVKRGCVLSRRRPSTVASVVAAATTAQHTHTPAQKQRKRDRRQGRSEWGRNVSYSRRHVCVCWSDGWGGVSLKAGCSGAGKACSSAAGRGCGRTPVRGGRAAGRTVQNTAIPAGSTALKHQRHAVGLAEAPATARVIWWAGPRHAAARPAVLGHEEIRNMTAKAYRAEEWRVGPRDAAWPARSPPTGREATR